MKTVVVRAKMFCCQAEGYGPCGVDTKKDRGLVASCLCVLKISILKTSSVLGESVYLR